MPKICLLCGENETPDGHNEICDPCYDNAGNYLEQNVSLIKAIPELIEACNLAEEEIFEWAQVMGSTDPQTQAALDALNVALRNAVRKNAPHSYE